MGMSQVRSEPEKGFPLCTRCGCRDEPRSIGIVELDVEEDPPEDLRCGSRERRIQSPAQPESSPAFRAPPAEVRGPTVFELENALTPTGATVTAL
mmetsp:Transcript_97983/g.136096  ORF Transcript_97983/g.136096 Transcript_97983/m.136096 type:complete len:95 (-) Transcript_97983:89-373(-)